MTKSFNILKPDLDASILCGKDDKPSMFGLTCFMEQIRLQLKQLVADFHKSKDLDEKLRIAALHIEILSKNIDSFQDDISNGVPNHEVWRNVIGYEGIYQISNYGRIKSIERFFIKNRRGGNQKMAVYCVEKIKAEDFSKFGYLRCSYWLNENAKHVFVHREVAKHFIPNPNNYPQVLHKDDNPKNARWDNLEWGTQKKNIQDCVSRGRWHLGEKNYKSKLKSEDIPKIRQLIHEGMSNAKIGEIFGVTDCPIDFIRKNKTWKHIK